VLAFCCTKSQAERLRERPVWRDTADNRILRLAKAVQKAEPKNQTILVSKDINLRIKRTRWVCTRRTTKTTGC